MATITAPLVLILPNMNNPKLLVTLRAQTGAPLYGPRDCSAHVRGRWSFDRTAAVSPKHAGLSHLRVRLQRRRCASDAQPTCQSAARILPYPVPLLSHRVPFNEPRLDLGCCLV